MALTKREAFARLMEHMCEHDGNVARARARDLLKSIHCVGDASVPAADMHLTLDQGGRALAHGRSH